MVKRLYLLAFCSVLAFSSQAAPAKLDSLRRVWQNGKLPDTSRLEALRKLTWDGYLMNQPDSGYYYAQLLLHAARIQKQPKYEGHALSIQGISLFLRGDMDQALKFYQQSLRLLQQADDKAGISSVWRYMAMIYDQRGDYAQSMRNYLKSLKMDEAIGNSKGVAANLLQIGNVYLLQEDYPKALEFFTRGLRVCQKQGYKSSIGNGFHNVAITKIALKRYTEAEADERRALAIGQEIGDPDLAALALTSLGTLATKRQDYRQALTYHTQALRLEESIDNQRGVTVALNNIGESHLHLRAYQQAILFGRRALALAQKTENLEMLAEAAKTLSGAYDATQKWKEALKMNQLATQTKDSLMRTENERGVIQARLQYEFDKKEALAMAERRKKEALAAAEIRQKDLQRNALLGGFGLMVLLAGVFFTQRNRISREKKRSDELLLNILPAEVAEELKDTGTTVPQNFDKANILFSDFKDFTHASELMAPRALVAELNVCFKAFDGIIAGHGIEKIKTIGDAYMAAGGLPNPQASTPLDVVLAGLEMQAFMDAYKAERQAQGLPFFEMRLGIHSGPIVAGIVGVKKFAYDIWGDAVNTAARMESSGEVGKVNISESTYALVKDAPGLRFIPRGKVLAKGKGEVEMYFVERIS